MFKKFLLTTIITIFIPITVPADYTTTQLNVRQYPNKDAKIIDVLDQNEYVNNSSSNQENWDKIETDEYTGYIYNIYLTSKEKEEVKKVEENKDKILYSPEEFQTIGMINWNGWTWTYYTLSEWPGQTSTPVAEKNITEKGYVCDENGYIILASADLSPYTVVETPFGCLGKVYDTGCPSGILDVYTDW